MCLTNPGATAHRAGRLQNENPQAVSPCIARGCRSDDRCDVQHGPVCEVRERFSIVNYGLRTKRASSTPQHSNVKTESKRQSTKRTQKKVKGQSIRKRYLSTPPFKHRVVAYPAAATSAPLAQAVPVDKEDTKRSKHQKEVRAHPHSSTASSPTQPQRPAHRLRKRYRVPGDPVDEAERMPRGDLAPNVTRLT